MSKELSEQERAEIIAKYGPVMSGELHIDLENGKVTGDGPMLAFWETLVDNYRARVAELEEELALRQECPSTASLARPTVTAQRR